MAKQNDTTKFKTTIGGQALIEGIMMRGPEKQAVVVQGADGLVIQEKPLKSLKDRPKIFTLPFFRGVYNFGTSMAEGVRSLMFSAEQMPEEEIEEPSRFDLWIEEKLGSEKAAEIIIYIAVVLGIGFSILLFFILPTFIGGLFDGIIAPGVWRSLLEGLIRILIFLGYLTLCSRMKSMKRVFAYHGAEHKTIFCYEKGLPLTVENVRAQPRRHPRCGTSFLFVVIFISIIVSIFISAENVWVRVGLRLLMLPLVVAVSYEFNRLIGRHDDALISRILSAPGKALQGLTTNEPDDEMIKVGIKALELVLPDDEGSDKW